VNVVESKIKTDISELTLTPGEIKYISVENYVRGIRQIFRSNNNIRAFNESFLENGERVYKIRIEALYSGTARNIFQDYKQPHNNYHVTPITITGDVQNPDYKEFHHPDAIDGCPRGDYSGNTNDGKCGKAPEVVEEEENTGEESVDEEIQTKIE